MSVVNPVAALSDAEMQQAYSLFHDRADTAQENSVVTRYA